ncbi:octanoyltransferase LipM [Spirochaetia bacterium]|nr:octanoyltransferase LipM [Spirochaetia bacterium]
MINDTYPFRLLNTGYNDCFFNMALDEALLQSISHDNAPPTLRFYGWNPPAVSIGSSLNITDVLNEDACSRYNIDIVRRISGGGAVFHHKELTYSIIIPDSHPLADFDLSTSYRHLCAGLIEGFALLGISTVFQPINDIIAGTKKISGNAQSRRLNCILQHGTILLDFDSALMFSLLKVREEKLRRKQIAAAHERVTSLHALGVDITFDEALNVFTKGFSYALSLELYAGEISDTEIRYANELVHNKFAPNKAI